MQQLSSILENLNDGANVIGQQIESKVLLKLRTAVSKDKNRFIDDNFNLDLTYITNRIIAMGFPSYDPLESTFRNTRSEVKKFLDHFHKDHYLIINLTEKSYDSTFFGGRVEHLGWWDHHSPGLGLLLYAIQRMHTFLNLDPLNVVAVHCAAGRGRTGTLICSYLISTLMYENQLNSALNLFASQRSSTGEGLRVPSQIRYVDYVNQLATRTRDIGLVQNPVPLMLKAIIMKPIPKVSSEWSPIIEILNVTRPLQPVLLLSTKDNDSFKITFKPTDPAAFINLQDLFVCGDILIRVYLGSNHLFSKEIFNVILDKPSFRFDSFCLDLGKSQLDEANEMLKNDLYPSDFSIRLIFGPCQFSMQNNLNQSQAVQPQPQPQPQQQQQQQQHNQYNNNEDNNQYGNIEEENLNINKENNLPIDNGYDTL
eukprot:gene1283-1619_t